MSWFSDFFNPEKGYEDAKNQMAQYYGQAQGYLSPYTSTGQNVYKQNLQPAMQSLLDPAALENQWVSGYQQSPYSQQAQEMAKQQGLDAMSSMGMLGSTPGLQAMQEGVTNIGLQDRQTYLNDLMQKYLAGTGLASSVYGTGANAANALAQQAMNMGQTMGGLTAAQHQASGGMLGGLLNIGGTLLGSAVGGPLGAYVGNKVGTALGGTYTPGTSSGGWSFTGGSGNSGGYY